MSPVRAALVLAALATAGEAPSPPALPRPDLLWRMPAGSPPLAAPIVLGPAVLTVDATGILRRFDAASGAEIDRLRLEGPATDLLVQAGGAVAVLASGRVVFLAAGTPVAEALDLGGVPAAPSGSNGTVLVQPLAGGELAAVDLVKRRLRWRVALDAPCTVAPAVGPATVAAATASGRLQILDLADGRPLAAVELGAPPRTSPGHAGGLFFAGAPGRRFLGIDAPSGRVRWRAEIGRGPASDVLALDEDAVLATLADHLVALRDNGTPAWRAPLPARVILRPRLHGDMVLVVPHRDGTVLGFDRRSGKPVLRRRLPDPFEIFTSEPAIGPEAIYLATSRGDVVALSPRRSDVRPEAASAGPAAPTFEPPDR